ncbi:hypothetical protein RF11_12488 [Thelohanellus kitauei]|uniref:Uncharacterized protein n=1 Tax=Thelohanellus kitauei TaxID=669202 RepID=A0A0C2IFN6_THEKT|nr:hypothetical protein RF11_12488 [Thelohanellus kitauei]
MIDLNTNQKYMERFNTTNTIKNQLSRISLQTHTHEPHTEKTKKSYSYKSVDKHREQHPILSDVFLSSHLTKEVITNNQNQLVLLESIVLYTKMRQLCEKELKNNKYELDKRISVINSTKELLKGKDPNDMINLQLYNDIMNVQYENIYN